MSWHLHVTVHGSPDSLHLQLTLVHCLVQARKLRSADASGPDRRDLRTNTDIVFKPPSHSLWRGLWVLQMTLLPNCCLTVGLLDVNRERIIYRTQNFWHKLWALWLMTDRARLTVSHCIYAHYILQMKSSASQEDHFFSMISADPSTAEKHSSKIPCQGVESHPVQAWNPSHNFWRWSLSVSEWFTVVWIGTCYLFIQIFGHFILSKCTSSNTAASVSCETKQNKNCWMLG